MQEQSSRKHLEGEIIVHLFTVSAAMVGVCLTVIGLLRVIITINKNDTFADDFLAFDAILFLISCLLSYWSLRKRAIRRFFYWNVLPTMFLF